MHSIQFVDSRTLASILETLRREPPRPLGSSRAFFPSEGEGAYPEERREAALP